MGFSGNLKIKSIHKAIHRYFQIWLCILKIIYLERSHTQFLQEYFSLTCTLIYEQVLFIRARKMNII
jgi:hypothetical protein